MSISEDHISKVMHNLWSLALDVTANSAAFRQLSSLVSESTVRLTRVLNLWFSDPRLFVTLFQASKSRQK